MLGGNEQHSLNHGVPCPSTVCAHISPLLGEGFWGSPRGEDSRRPGLGEPPVLRPHLERGAEPVAGAEPGECGFRGLGLAVEAC